MTILEEVSMLPLYFENRNIALLPNPTSDKAKDIAGEVALLLKGMDVVHSVFENEWPANFNGFSEAWIVGGDGTLNYFINRYRDIKLPLAVIRGGTGNDFHWMFYGDILPEAQVEQLLEGNVRWVDAGRCNERYFLNNLGIGFDAKVSRDLLGKKKRSGKTSYMLAVLKNIFFFQSFSCSITTAKQNLEQESLMVSVCNGKRTGGGFYLAPKAFIDDGLLDLTIVDKIHPVNRMRYLPLIEKGKHLALAVVQHEQTASIKILAAKPMHAHVDGEYFVSDHFDVECLPKRFAFLF
jgi:diacylglycerol kinase (ATP)